MILRYTLLTLLLPIFAGCCGSESPIPPKTLKYEERLIDEFADTMWATVQAKDEHKFLSFRMTRDDPPVNFLHPDGPPPPLSYDTTYQGVPDQELLSRFHSAFAQAIKQLQDLVGDPSKADLLETRYLIDVNPFYMGWGVFVFDYTLVIHGRGRTAYILQHGNYLSAHGVRWLAPIEVYAKDPYPP